MGFSYANNAWARAAAALGLAASVSGAGCGGSSELDAYEDGIPDIIPAPVPPKGGAGTACTADSDCKGTDVSPGLCAKSLSLSAFGAATAFSGGYCTNRCTTSTECASKSACVTQPRSCLATCVSNADCRVSEGYSCQKAPSGGGNLSYCLPPLSSGGLLGGLLGGILGSQNP
jgi:hypothetical protein